MYAIVHDDNFSLGTRSRSTLLFFFLKSSLDTITKSVLVFLGSLSHPIHRLLEFLLCCTTNSKCLYMTNVVCEMTSWPKTGKEMTDKVTMFTEQVYTRCVKATPP